MLDVLLVLAAIVGAWAFSIWIRMEWIEIAEDRPNTQWEEHYLPTTHDSYLFATIIQQSAQTNALEEPLLNLPDRHRFGALTLLGTALAKQGQPVLDIVTYLPIYLAGLITIPVVLIGRLYGSTLAGFAAACLATAGSSFFNRTMAGYLDTDIFSVTIPVFILYFLLRAHRESSVPWMVAGSVSVMCYPFFYSSGVPIVTAMALTFMGLRGLTELKAWWKSKGLEKDASASGEPSISFSLLSVSLLAAAVWFCPHSIGSQLARNAAPFILGCLMLGGLTAGYYWLKSRPLRQRLRFLGGTTVVALIAMCLGSQSIQSIWQNAFRYLPVVKQAKEEKVQGPQPVAYKNVMETVVEAGSREQKAEMRRVVMQRISGSTDRLPHRLSGIYSAGASVPGIHRGIAVAGNWSLCLLGRVSVHRARRANRSHRSGIAALRVDGDLPTLASESSTRIRKIYAIPNRHCLAPKLVDWPLDVPGFDSRPYYARIAAQPEVKQRPIRRPHARAGHDKSGTTRPHQTRIPSRRLRPHLVGLGLGHVVPRRAQCADHTVEPIAGHIRIC